MNLSGLLHGATGQRLLRASVFQFSVANSHDSAGESGWAQGLRAMGLGMGTGMEGGGHMLTATPNFISTRCLVLSWVSKVASEELEFEEPRNQG